MIQQTPQDRDLTLVHLVRHGEVHNPEGVLYARLPGFHLNARGRLIAQRVAEHLAGAPVADLRSSPLERATDTMEPIAAVFPEVTVRIDDRLIEADSLLQGQVFGKHNRAVFDPRNWPLFRNPARPSWGEPYQRIAERMLAVIADSALTAGPGKQSVLVSHQSPIWTVRRAAEGRSLQNSPLSRHCTLGSITTFHVLEGRIVDVRYAEPARDLLGADANRAFSSGD